ncbi:glycosyltransferase [Arthrobacter sp. JSM 101049]|uniref:glycosyltransferase n=1 Tax=Arthrobacter sp. JSM 101049 TaxID=929097 RepID=UPI003564FCD8
MTGPRPPADMRYFMALWGIADEFGGMTTMSLYRACIFLEESGIVAPILTFEPRAGYDRQLQTLRSHGKTTTDVTVLNPFAYYREASLEAPGAAERFQAAGGLAAGATSDDLDDDGTPFCRTTFHEDGKTVSWREYLRPNGTAFLYDEYPTDADGKKSGRLLTLVTDRGEVVGRWTKAADFYREWMVELAGGHPTTVIVDSAFASKVIAPLRRENIIKLMVLHNAHVAAGGDPVRGKIATGQQPILSSVNDWDGIVFLTDEQRHDYEARFGRTTNLFTVSNPKERADTLPDFAGRPAQRGVLLGRLAPQKNLQQAIRVMAKVRETLPDATLDIYGKGPDEAELLDLIAELGLEETVYLRGHIPHAADQFDVARFSLLTSRNEGQPLALMESQGRGCPPVSYAIRYGPRDIIEDGVSGYLVEPGDIDAAASCIVRLCTDDDLAARLSRGSWERAERFGKRAIVDRWLDTVGAAWSRRRQRTDVRALSLQVQEIVWWRPGILELVVRAGWKQQGGPAVEQQVAVEAMVVPRSAGPASSIPASIVETSAGSLLATVKLDASSLAAGVGDSEEFLDVFCRIVGPDFAAMFRVGFPEEASSVPFATPQRALSLRTDS